MGGKGFEIFNCDVNKKDHDDSQEKDCAIRIMTNVLCVVCMLVL